MSFLSNLHPDKRLISYLFASSDREITWVKGSNPSFLLRLSQACNLAEAKSALPVGQRASVTFISAVTGTPLEQLPADHWQRWCSSPVKFADALEAAKDLLQGSSPVVLEMGPHPVLYQAVKVGRAEGMSFRKEHFDGKEWFQNVSHIK